MQALEKASPVQVELVDGQITTTSLDVASHFKKRHDTVLRAIRLLECSAEFTARNFAVSEYTDPTGRKLKQFRMTRDGFAFLAMGFTGKEAAKWKEAYINAFNRLEQELRKHDSAAADTIVNELIGMTELGVIKGLIRDKAKALPADRRRGFQLKMHNRLHTRFNVPRTELIPAGQFEPACNFIAAYALEGEWLPKDVAASAVDACSWSNIAFLVDCVEKCWKIVESQRLATHLSGLGCNAGIELASFLWDGLGSAAHVRKHCANELDWRKGALA